MRLLCLICNFVDVHLSRYLITRVSCNETWDTKPEKSNGACLFRCAELPPRGPAAKLLTYNISACSPSRASFHTSCQREACLHPLLPSRLHSNKRYESGAVTLCTISLICELSAATCPPSSHIQSAPFAPLFASPLHCTDSAFTLCSCSAHSRSLQKTSCYGVQHCRHPPTLQHLSQATQLQRCLTFAHAHCQQRPSIQLLQGQGPLVT
jgi:hypothetical protein